MIAEVRGSVAALGGRSGFGHVLHHDVTRRKSADERRTLVADHRANPVVLLERVGGGAGAGLLPQPEVNAADNFALLVERFERSLHATVQEHPAIDFDELLLVQVFRVAEGWSGRGEV